MEIDKGALRHVLWIGGATDSGKTSVARALAERFGLQTYHYDLFDRETPPGHWSRIDPKQHPHMYATNVADRDWMWVDTTPEVLVQRWRDTVPERFGLTLQDLLAMPPHPPIVAEGYGITPSLVAPLLSTPHQAIWLISTEEVKRHIYVQRGKGRFIDTRDPERARANHMARDLLLADLIRTEAMSLDMPFIDIDGSQSLEEVTDTVAAHMAPVLRGGVSAN